MEISTLIKKLPEKWTCKDKSGNVKTKYDLVRCAYGEHKEGESVLAFQVAILQKYPPRSKSVTQFDTLITGDTLF